MTEQGHHAIDCLEVLVSEIADNGKKRNFPVVGTLVPKGSASGSDSYCLSLSFLSTTRPWQAQEVSVRFTDKIIYIHQHEDKEPAEAYITTRLLQLKSQLDEYAPSLPSHVENDILYVGNTHSS